jgi:hypothetical protein
VYECYTKSQPLSYGCSNLIHGCIQRAERKSGGRSEGREGAIDTGIVSSDRVCKTGEGWVMRV